MKHPQLLALAVAATLSMGMIACSDDTSNNNANTTNMPAKDMKADQRTDMVITDMGKDATTADETADIIADADMNLHDLPDLTPDLEPDIQDSTPDLPDPRTLDDDYDRLSNYDESQGCTDPNNFDTDGDFVDDYSEYQQGTDPCSKDTDGDGVDDGVEIDYGLDPTNPQTYTGTSDDELFIITACNTPESEPVNFAKSNKGDWLIGLPTAFGNYSELTIANTQPREAAAVYDDPANEVSGFILSVEKGTNTALPTLLGYNTKIAQVGTIFQDLTEGEFDTHDRFKAAPGEYRIRATGKSARKIRDDLLFAIAPFSASNVTGLPVSSGNTHPTFYIKLTVIERGDRLITLAAIAPEALYNTRDQVKFRLSDLTNTTSVAQAGDGEELRCHRFPTTVEIPSADFYWVLDQSGSMGIHFAKVKSFANDFYTQLLNTALDFRLGVTNMEESNKGHLNPTVGWHTDPTTFTGQINNFVINCPSPCSGSEEHGLYVAREGIKHMRNSSTPLSERIRPNAQLATIFMTDEEDQSLKDQRDPGGPSTTRAQLLNDYTAFFANNPIAFAIVSPGRPCSSQQGAGYQDVALASGGATASLCANDLRGTIGQILDNVAGRASTFRLPQTPISSTLRVYVGDPSDPTKSRWVPRSRQDGFDYFPQSNAIAFFGSYRPTSGMMDAVQVAVHYRTFLDRTKTPPMVNP